MEFIEEPLNFIGLAPAASSIIKVIGVGGGGSNAVNHMYEEGIHDVTFVVCNTDNQALANSPVSVKLQLGRKTTEGLGAGARPERAQEAARESFQEIENLLNDNTKMAFVTAGMGGGTGTGAAPVVAQIAKEMGILTVGIVTIPFAFEGKRKILQALDGVEEISKHVDALLVVNNERLKDIYPDLTLKNAFKKADDTLTIAAKSIAEIITLEGYVNCDFADVSTIMKDGGVAIMSAGFGEGEHRITKALEDALQSPLLNNNNVFDAKKVLLYLSSSDNEEYMVRMEEMTEIHEFMYKFGKDVEVIWGAAFDSKLQKDVKVTILATGFDISAIPDIKIKEQEAVKEKEEENARKEEKENERIEKAYGRDKTKAILRHGKKAEIITLDQDQMENNNLLDILDTYAPYNRDSTVKSKIKAQLKIIL